MDIAELLSYRKIDPLWNTSYPLAPKDWEPFRVASPLYFKGESELSFYIHIPFCKQLCSFCEYTRMMCPDDETQKKYLTTILSDILKFKEQNRSFLLKGFDIGGGTPTALSDANFNFLMDIYGQALIDLTVSDDFEPSIEATFQTLSASKLESLVRQKILRLSLGVQTTCKDVLGQHHRRMVQLDDMKRWMFLAWETGIAKINLDLMYGLTGQSSSTIDEDLQAIKVLRPQQVTLYELRTNMLTVYRNCPKQELFDMYKRYYDGLVVLGYYARFGQNTFSLDPDDCGVSSYLRSRMLYGVSYKGFGLSAQSMNKQGIAYNMGKSKTSISQLMECDSFSEEYTYLLPGEEIASKYIAISAYNCSFSTKRASELLGCSFVDRFKEQLNFCLTNDYVTFDGDRVCITPKGFPYYGAIFSLFYPSKIYANVLINPRIHTMFS